MTNRARTAIARQDFSKPYRRLLETGVLHEGITVLDYGCGRGYDVQRLQNFPGSVDVSLTRLNIRGYDPFQPGFNCPESLEMVYDVVTCNYVLNVIEDAQERLDVIRRLTELAPVVYITVRADAKAIKPNWTAYGDGYLTSAGTFQKFYDAEELISEVAKAFHKFEITYSGIIEHADSSEITIKLERN